jgi:hypothetical protein
MKGVKKIEIRRNQQEHERQLETREGNRNSDKYRVKRLENEK